MHQPELPLRPSTPLGESDMIETGVFWTVYEQNCAFELSALPQWENGQELGWETSQLLLWSYSTGKMADIFGLSIIILNTNRCSSFQYLIFRGLVLP